MVSFSSVISSVLPRLNRSRIFEPFLALCFLFKRPVFSIALEAHHFRQMATPPTVEQIACSFCPKGRLLAEARKKKAAAAEKSAPPVDNIECDSCAKGRRIKLQQQAARSAALARGEQDPIGGQLRTGPMTPAQMRDDHKKQAARAAAVLRGLYPPDPFDDGGPARNTGPLPYELRMHLTYLAEVGPEARADPERDLVAEWDSPEQVALRKLECSRNPEGAEVCALEQSEERDALKYQQAVRRSITHKDHNPVVFKHSQAERDVTAPSPPRSTDMISCSVCNKQKKRKDMIHYTPKNVSNIEGSLMMISMCDMGCLTRAEEDKLVTIKK